MRNTKARILTEAAMLIAIAQILSYIVLYRFPQGGSIDASMLPIVLFAIRHGAGWAPLPALFSAYCSMSPAMALPSTGRAWWWTILWPMPCLVSVPV